MDSVGYDAGCRLFQVQSAVRRLFAAYANCPLIVHALNLRSSLAVIRPFPSFAISFPDLFYQFYDKNHAFLTTFHVASCRGRGYTSLR